MFSEEPGARRSRWLRYARRSQEPAPCVAVRRCWWLCTGVLSVLQKAEGKASRPVELPAETIDTDGVYKRKVKCDSKQAGSFFN